MSSSKTPNWISLRAGTDESMARRGAATQATGNNNGGVHSPATVGMWEGTLFAGGAVYDHAFQQLHCDGLESQNRGSGPPAFANSGRGCWPPMKSKNFNT